MNLEEMDAHLADLLLEIEEKGMKTIEYLSAVDLFSMPDEEGERC